MTDAVNVFPPGFRVTDADVNPVPGAVLRFYDAGTTNPRTVYSDSALTVPLGTVVYCDSGGAPVSSSGGTNKVVIYTGTTAYKVVAETALGSQVWSLDDLKGAVDTSAISTTFSRVEVPAIVKTASYTIQIADLGKSVDCDTTSGAVTAVLPSAVTAEDGATITIKKTTGSNTVTISPVSGQTIDGAGSKVLTAVGDSITLRSNGANWREWAFARPSLSSGAITSDVLDPRIVGGLAQVGDVKFVPYETVPSGWLECNGAAVSRTTYADLYAKIGTSHGQGDGTTTFNIPDYRGRFLRGWDHGAGRDPDSVYRTAMNTGGATADHVGSIQDDQNKTHTHTYSVPTTSRVYGSTGSPAAWDASTSTGTSGASGGYEARPKNAYLMGIILADPAAAAGASGALHTVYATSGTPSPSLGIDGDFAIDYSIYAVYGPKASGSWGTGTGMIGATGASGPVPIDYTWDTGTSAANPGTGKIRANNATLSSATALYINETDRLGNNLATLIQQWDDTSNSIKGQLIIVDTTAPAKRVYFNVTGAVVDNGSYDTITVAYVAGVTSLTAVNVAIMFMPAGTVGSISDTTCQIANPAKFWNPTYFGNPGTAQVTKLNRLMVGVASLSSTDRPLSTSNWMDDLTVGGTYDAQFCAISALGNLGVVGASRCSDFRTWVGSDTGGAQGVSGFALQDDAGAGTPIACGVFGMAYKASGVAGVTEAAEFTLASNGTVVDMTPQGGVVGGAAIGVNITCGDTGSGTDYTQAGSTALNVGISYVAKWRNGINIEANSLDTALGSGGGGVAMQVGRGASIRWQNPSTTWDCEVWGDSSGLNVKTLASGGARYSYADDGALAGPYVILERVSASPAASDLLGSVLYRGKSSTAVNRSYVEAFASIVDPTNGAELGEYIITPLVSGSPAYALRAANGVRAGSPSGGYKGVGSVNAEILYEQGAALADLYRSAQPMGRLTLTTAVPVLTSTVSGASTIYYTPYIGNMIPVYDGTRPVNYVFTELSNATAQSSTGKAGPAAVTTNSNYDLFVWNDSGTMRLTRGPAWTSDTARGTGAGTTELQRIAGMWTNAQAITNGPAANRGTYVGTVRSNGSSTIDWIYGGIAAGGTAGRFCVWNAYHRRPVASFLGDSTDSWSYTTGAWRAADNSTAMRFSYVCGLNEDAAEALYLCYTTAGASGAGNVGVGVDVTNAITGTGASVYNATAQASAEYVGYPGLGFHFLQAIEYGAAGVTFNGDSNNPTQTQSTFSFKGFF